MLYAQIKNKQVVKYPLSQQDIKAMFPHTSFLSDFVPPEGFVSVEINPAPQIDYTQNAIESNPEEINGVWTQAWVIEPASSDEILYRTQQKESEIRKKRQDLLIASDWTHIEDSPLTTNQKALWASYRSALRDITNQAGFPWSVEWPSEPQRG